MGSQNDQRLSEERVQTSVLAGAEKRLLQWIARRLPRWVTPDMLTLLGLLALAGIGVAYYFAARHWLFLVAANVGLVVNWFGDSLDGTLARVRNIERPKYGYYLDHLVDAFGVSLMLFGLAYSGLVSKSLGFSVLTLYLIMSINAYLATQTVGVFKISYARLSTTEGRVLLIALNTVLIFVKKIEILSQKVLILDVVSVFGAAVLLVLTLRSALLNLRILDRDERAHLEKEETVSS